jgi:hypothetical protein
VFAADGLDHLHADHRVVLSRHVPVVLEPDVDQVAEARVIGAAPDGSMLIRRQRDIPPRAGSGAGARAGSARWRM